MSNRFNDFPWLIVTACGIILFLLLLVSVQREGWRAGYNEGVYDGATGKATATVVGDSVVVEKDGKLLGTFKQVQNTEPERRD